MKGRLFIQTSFFMTAAGMAFAEIPRELPGLPRRECIRVAFLPGPDTNVIDAASARCFGKETAKATARYLEHESQRWR